MEIKKMKDFCVLHLNFDMHIGNRCQAFPNDSYITDSSTECRSVPLAIFNNRRLL